MDTSLHELINLSGKTAVVTGGAKGIGLGIVRRLHEAGANVVVADLDDAALESIRQELNARRADSAAIRHVDVSSADDVTDMVNFTVETYGRLDILVNNAGIFPYATLADMTEELFMKVQDVNLRSVFLATKQASEKMKAQGGGVIINVASIDSLHPSMAGLAAYDASKHGVWGFTKNVAIELAESNIRVNALAPGGIATPGVAAMTGGTTDPGTLQRIPMHRIGDPDEMGRVALFLASDLSSYMTGSIVVADGGLLLA